MHCSSRWLLWCCLCVVPVRGFAASPWYVDEAATGVPYAWKDGKITWYLEEGSLGAFSNAQVKEIIEKAFAKWAGAGLLKSGAGSLTKINTAKLESVFGGSVADAQTLSKDTSLKTIIILDDTGELIADLVGEAGGDPAAIVGMTQPFWETAQFYPHLGVRSAKNIAFVAGVMILNGLFVQKAVPDDPKDAARLQLEVTVLHELGHLLGLDHSGVNDALGDELVNDQNLGKGLPTMHPIIQASQQKALHEDDVVSVSNVYPRPALTDTFCTIAGNVLGSDGLGFQGVQVVARSVKDPLTVAISGITGNAFPQGTADGSYILRGIHPNTDYTVGYEELPVTFVGASSIQPFGDEAGELPRSGFGSGEITAGNGKATKVRCLNPGETLLMDPVQLAVQAGGTPPKNQLVPITPPAPGGSVAGGETGGGSAPAAGESKGGCALLPY